jgi:hypothetical protein
MDEAEENRKNLHMSGVYKPAFHRGGPGSIPGHMEFMVDKVGLWQVFSDNSPIR